MAAGPTLFLEDLAPGQRFGSPTRELAIGPGYESNAVFAPGSQVHVASLTMRLIVESDFRPTGGILGAGIEGLHWPTPARLGDRLRVESEILEVRRSKSRPDRGLARVRNTTLNAAGEPVQVMTSTVVVSARTTVQS